MATITMTGAVAGQIDRDFVITRARLRLEEARKESIADPENKELYERWCEAYRAYGRARHHKKETPNETPE